MSTRHIVRALVATTALAAAPFVTGLTASPANAAPPTPHFTAAIEKDAMYQPQTTCIATAQPGVVKFRALLLAAYPGTGDSGITRPCTDGGRSEHKEGRAFDWTVNIHNASQVAAEQNLLYWLWATDQYGNLHAMARRLGIMYIIWNAHIWNAGSSHWAPYACSGVTDCHQDHMHFSFDWAGALGRTSYWTGKVTDYAAPPVGLLDDRTLPASVTVPATSDTPIYTPFTLPAGHKYRITATGVFSYGVKNGQQMLADAECSWHPQDNIWHRWTYWEGDPGHNAVDLFVSGNPVWVRQGPSNGYGCATDHTYYQDVTMRTTSQLSMIISDSGRYDNSGSLRVTITKL